MRILFLFGVLAIISVSCGNSSTSEHGQVAGNESSKDSAAASHHQLGDIRGVSTIQFASDSDTTCGMPLGAGITDTTFYAGKIYGFCSAGCKQQFTMLVAGTSGPAQQ